jgi:hypothetical protein
MRVASAPVVASEGGSKGAARGPQQGLSRLDRGPPPNGRRRARKSPARRAIKGNMLPNRPKRDGSQPPRATLDWRLHWRLLTGRRLLWAADPVTVVLA